MDLYCLSEQAILELKKPGIKWIIMNVLGINDPRTIDKHMKNNFPNGPLMNFNVRQIIKELSPHLNDKDVYHKLSTIEKENVCEKQKEKQETNAKYNNLKN